MLGEKRRAAGLRHVDNHGTWPYADLRRRMRQRIATFDRNKSLSRRLRLSEECANCTVVGMADNRVAGMRRTFTGCSQRRLTRMSAAAYETVMFATPKAMQAVAK